MLTTQYKFTTLNNITPENEYNFFAIIYDSSFPQYYPTPQPHYETTIKCIDNSSESPFSNSITLIIKSYSKEQIPYIHKTGLIIRVICGLCKYSKNSNKRLIYVNLTNEKVSEKASWYIYDSSNLIMSSSSDIISNENENEIISNLNNYFSYVLYEKYINAFSDNNILLSERLSNTKSSEIDSIVLVTHKEILDDKIVLYVQDENDGCELHTYKYFDFVNINDVIRLRNFNVFNQHIIVLKHSYGNILTIPQNTNIYKEFMNKIIAKANSSNILNNGTPLTQFDILQDTPSKVKENSNKKRYVFKFKNNVSNVNELKIKAIKPQHKTFILNTEIIDVFADENSNNNYNIEVENILKCICMKCNFEIKLSNKMVLKCANCGCVDENKVIVYFNMCFTCKDNNDLLYVNLCDYDNEGEGFFNVKAIDVYRSNSYRKSFEQLFNKITSTLKHSPLNAKLLIEQNSVGIYRIIGKYNFNSKNF